jgi:hypothetical protein
MTVSIGKRKFEHICKTVGELVQHVWTIALVFILLLPYLCRYMRSSYDCWSDSGHVFSLGLEEVNSIQK